MSQMHFFLQNANRLVVWGVCDRAWVAHWAGKLALAGFPVLLSVGGVGEVGLVLNGFSHFSECGLLRH